MERDRLRSGTAGDERTAWIPVRPVRFPEGLPGREDLGGRCAPPRVRASEYEGVFERALCQLDARLRGVAGERATAARLYLRLIGRPVAHRLLLLDNLDLEHALCLATLLIDEGHRRAVDRPAEAIEHAELATRVAARLCRCYYGRFLVAEISARAWACLGDVCRLSGRLGRAEQAFSQALHHLATGSGEPLEEGLVFEHEAALHATRRRMIEADRRLGQAAVRFRQVRDLHLEARVHIKQGVVELLRGRRSAAILRLTSGLDRLERPREPYAAAAAHALLAALLATDPKLTAQARARAELRQARVWLDRPEARPVRMLVTRVETLILGTPPQARRPPREIPPEVMRLVPVWPRRL